MTTNFALLLSFEGIELLHRVPRGWKPVGRKADVEDPKLDSILADLRAQALALEPDGLRTKIIIPMDQIKYLAIDSTLTDMDDIHAALDGTTPYALNDLVIDYEKSGGRTHVAAVARETLFEAEAFARAHRFAPVCFVAVPEPFTFQKEVFFGPTAMMQEVLGPGGTVDRDALPVMTVGTRIKSRLLVFDIPEENLPDGDEDDLAALFGPQVNADTAPAADEKPLPSDGIDLAALLAPHVAEDDTHAPEVQLELLEVMTAEPASKEVDRPAVVEAEAIPETPVAEMDAAEELAASATAQEWIDRIVAECHFPPLPVTDAAPAASVAVEIAPAPAPAPAIIDRIIPEVAWRVNAISDRPATLGRADPVAPAFMDPIVPEYHGKRPVLRLVAQVPRLSAASRGTGAAGATPNRKLVIGGAIAASLMLAGALAWTQLPRGGDTVAMVTPPVQAAAPEVGPDVPGVVLEATLTQPAPDAGAAPILTVETAVSFTAPPVALAAATPDAPLAPIAAPPEPPEETVQATVGAPVLRGRVLSPDEAQQIYRATGVWQRAARPARVPETTSTDGMIRPVTLPVPGRIAQPEVPPLENLDTDLSFIAPADPPPPDVAFPIDEDGFILATPEGTPTPEGAIVFAGLPDLTVRARPELSQADLDRMALLAPAPEGVVIIAGTPAVIPPLRPADASLPEDDTVLDNAARVEVAADQPTPGAVALTGLRPDAAASNATEVAAVQPETRPGAAASTVPSNPDITSIIAGITAEEDAAAPAIDPTEGTVAASRRPETRPRNFDRVVAAARERQAAQIASAAAAAASAAAAPPPRVEAAAPVAPQNYAPVPGGVARAATQEDVIRLREMNLIGVYGRPNARRALVRLPNGRYVRVEVGSALDGGQVTAIGESALNYVKRGRTYALELPSG